MTLREALQGVDELKFNTYSTQDKLRWLSDLDANVFTTVLQRHEGAPEGSFHGYGPDTDPETELLVKSPFEEIYLRWLESRIDYHNGEFDRYNASIRLFNAVWEEFVCHYRQTHLPRSRGIRFRF